MIGNDGRASHVTKQSSVVTDGAVTEYSHTPGPYRVTRKFEVGPVSQSDDQSNGMVIPLADVYSENRVADARLFAAAPDLLKACEAAEEWLSGWASAEPYLSTIRAAILLARGDAT